MKRIIFAFAAVATLLAAVSCENKEKQPVEIKVQLSVDDLAFAAEGVTVTLTEATGIATFEELTDASGIATFNVTAGMYNASTSFKNAEDGVVKTYTGSSDFQVLVATPGTQMLPLNKVQATQLIIKELYCTGCPKNAGTTGYYANDAYVTIYNNSEFEADASDIVFSLVQPANAHATNKYLIDGKLTYEDAGYVPAYSAIWSFNETVKIAPYSSLTVAIFGAIDHTKTYDNSVDLSKPEYYVMSKEGCAQITNSKYQVAETISKSHYLTASMFNAGNSWVISNSAPAFFMGKMPKDELKALVDNTGAYDITGGTTNVGWAPKFPNQNIVDAIECWDATQVERSNNRFPASVNTGHIALTKQLGHTHYRNVDAEATEALAENAGKLVKGYADDPSGIDAEASIKAGAHIIYKDTNDSGKDFHERKTQALK